MEALSPAEEGMKRKQGLIGVIGQVSSACRLGSACLRKPKTTLKRLVLPKVVPPEQARPVQSKDQGMTHSH